MKDTIIAGAMMLFLVSSPLLLITWSGQFYMNPEGNTATKGIFLKDTINLVNYKVLGEADALFCSNGAYIYTRSPMHQSFKVCKNAK